MTHALIDQKTRITVTGTDSSGFLQGLITTDIDALKTGEASLGTLLTPQGKIMFCFLISKIEEGFEIEIDTSEAEAFAKRLMMYKLRAKLDIKTGHSGATEVYWNEPAPADATLDLRFRKAGIELYRSPANTDEGGNSEAYHALRAECGIVEPGYDFALQGVFPHDIMMDKSGGVSFSKGCFVGQEVVSRMQHRATARRRVVLVKADQALPASGREIIADGKTVGTLGTVAGTTGLAIARIDRIGAALATGASITAGDIPVSLSLPEWSGLDFPSTAAEE